MIRLSILLTGFLVVGLLGCAPQTEPTATPEPAATSVDPFLGDWGLYPPSGAGWLSVRQEEGYLDGDLLWQGGSVLPVAHLYFADGVLTVTRIEDESPDGDIDRRFHVTDRFVLRVDGDSLSGEGFFPSPDGMGETVVPFMAGRVPALPPAPDFAALSYGEPIELFNGEDLTGWRLTDPDASNGWGAEDGVLVNNPVQPEGAEDGDHPDHIHYGNLRTEATFEDFNLTLEVNVPEGSNSGIYLRGIYEVQVADSYGEEPDAHNMGGIYSRIAPSEAAENPAGEWQSFDITLADRHVTVILNGTTIIDNEPLLGVTGDAITANQLAPGPILLQGDHGRVSYRNLVLRPIVN